MPTMFVANRFFCLVLLCSLSFPCFAEPTDRLSLLPLLAGEFALQAGNLEGAAQWYQAALQNRPTDPVLAERATRVALQAGNMPLTDRGIRAWQSIAPSSPALIATQAAVALHQHQSGRAYRALRQLLTQNGGSQWRTALSVLAGADSADRAQAIRVLDRLVRHHQFPNVDQVWQEAGRLALRLHDAKLVDHVLREWAAGFPNEPRVALLQATLLQQSGQRDAAIDRLHHAEAIITAQPEPDLLNALALGYEALHDTDAAIRVLMNGPHSVQTDSLLAALFARRQDRPKLAALYQQVQASADGHTAEGRLLLGDIADALDRYEEALRWYRDVHTDPQQDEAQLRMVTVYEHLGQRAPAEAILHRLQAMDGVGEVARTAYLVEAQLQWRAGRVNQEFAVYARGLAKFPNDSELLYGRALAWERRDQITQAETDLRQVMQIQPTNSVVMNALGYLLADRTTRYREALDLIQTALAAEPNNAMIIDSYGWVLYRLKRYQEALTALQRAWSHYQDAELAAHLAEVYWVLNQPDQARHYLQLALQLDPNDRALKRVQGLIQP